MYIIYYSHEATANKIAWSNDSCPHVSAYTLIHPIPSIICGLFNHLASPEALFMPGELTQAEFFHYYTASQRRVELWVQETNKTLSIQGPETQLPEKDILSFLPSPQQTQTQLPPPIRPLPISRSLKEQESPGQDAAGKPPRLSSSRSKNHGITRTPSKHRVHDPSRSRSRPSSGTKKIARGHDKPITKASRSTSTRPRGAGRHSSEDTFGLAAYIPYGVLPLLFAVTGASTLSIVAGVILLSGFVYVEQLHENPQVSWRTSFVGCLCIH